MSHLYWWEISRFITIQFWFPPCYCYLQSSKEVTSFAQGLTIHVADLAQQTKHRSGISKSKWQRRVWCSLSQKPKSVSNTSAQLNMHWDEQSETNRPLLGCRVSGKEFCSCCPSLPPSEASSTWAAPTLPSVCLPASLEGTAPLTSCQRAAQCHNALCPDHSPETGHKWGWGKQIMWGSSSALVPGALQGGREGRKGLFNHKIAHCALLKAVGHSSWEMTFLFSVSYDDHLYLVLG